MPNNITDAAARSAKARKTLDRMRARAVKADEARTAAAHHARAAQVVAAATEAATANRTAAEAWDAVATEARPGRPVPPRGRAGRPHPAAVGALGRRGRWRTRGGLSGRTAAWRWRSRAECNTARAWPTPVTGYHRRAAGTHGRHRSRGAGHPEASGRDGRHTQGEA